MDPVTHVLPVKLRIGRGKMVADDLFHGLVFHGNSQDETKELVSQREVHPERVELQGQGGPDVTLKDHLPVIERRGGLLRDVVFVDELKAVGLGACEEVVEKVRGKRAVFDVTGAFEAVKVGGQKIPTGIEGPAGVGE